MWHSRTGRDSCSVVKLRLAVACGYAITNLVVGHLLTNLVQLLLMTELTSLITRHCCNDVDKHEAAVADLFDSHVSAYILVAATLGLFNRQLLLHG